MQPDRQSTAGEYQCGTATGFQDIQITHEFKIC